MCGYMCVSMPRKVLKETHQSAVVSGRGCGVGLEKHGQREGAFITLYLTQLCCWGVLQ